MTLGRTEQSSMNWIKVGLDGLQCISIISFILIGVEEEFVSGLD